MLEIGKADVRIELKRASNGLLRLLLPAGESVAGRGNSQCGQDVRPLPERFFGPCGRLVIGAGRSMARRKLGKLESPAVEERVGADQERVCSDADKRGEGGLDPAAVNRLNDFDLYSDG
jgi:hypothetical protein